MTPITKTLFILSLFFFVGCSKDDCVDESAKTNNACAEIYQPVCGCDGKTYGNACEADNAGVMEYRDGECR